MSKKKTRDLTHRSCGWVRDDFIPTIDRLLDFEARTQPSAGAQTSQDKDFLSRCALSDAGELIAPLIKWAIHHQAGLIINEIEGAPLPPAGHKDNPEYLAATKTANNHRHEVAGAQYDYSDPRINRRILVCLLQVIISADPELVCDATAGLEALDVGEVHLIFKPGSKGKQHPAHSLWTARLRAVGHVEFRRGLGKSKQEATEAVAAAYGCSVSTVEAWRKRIPGELSGPLGVKDTLYRYRAQGQAVYDSTFNDPAGKLKLAAKLMQELHGDEALERDGRVYVKTRSNGSVSRNGGTN